MSATTTPRSCPQLSRLLRPHRFISLLLFSFALVFGTSSASLAQSRTYKNTPCPGTPENATLVVQGEDMAQGLCQIKNLGSCALYLMAVNARGRQIGLQSKIFPEENLAQYPIPIQGEKILFACSAKCQGTAILRYENCSFI